MCRRLEKLRLPESRLRPAIVRRGSNHFASISQHDLSGRCHVHVILGSIADHGNAIAYLERVPIPAAPKQCVRSGRFKGPIPHFSRPFVHVQIKVCVRAHPLHLGDYAFEGDLLGSIELKREGMMRPKRTDDHGQCGKLTSGCHDTPCGSCRKPLIADRCSCSQRPGSSTAPLCSKPVRRGLVPGRT